jgi:hypothetical protein
MRSIVRSGRRRDVFRRAPNSQAHAVLSRAIAAVSRALLQDVTGCFKRLVKINYESRKELEQAPEWEELIKLFLRACDTYADIAMGYRQKIKGDTLGWVKAQIEEDANRVSKQHFGCDRNGYHVQHDASTNSLNDNRDTWRAHEHWGMMNSNAFWSSYYDNMERALSMALGNAAIRVASGEEKSSLPPAKQVTSATRDSAQGLFPAYSVPLSVFESTVGKLMVQSRMTCPTKYLPQAEIVRLAGFLDDKGLSVRDNLEREAGRKLAKYNQLHPRTAIRSWRTALSHPQFRRAVRKRFSRTEEKFKKANPPVVVVSRGTSRTAI